MIEAAPVSTGLDLEIHVNQQSDVSGHRALDSRNRHYK